MIADQDDRTLVWLEAFAKAEVTLTAFNCAPGGFLRSAVWEDTVALREPRPVAVGLRRRFVARVFAWDARMGLRSEASGFTSSIECERIAVHVLLPGLTPARYGHWTRYVGDGVNIETADALGDNAERWHALCVNGLASVVHVPPLTWDRDPQLDADPRRTLPILHDAPDGRQVATWPSLTEAQAIMRVVRVYAACARSFAANPLTPRLRKRDANAPALEQRVLDYCLTWMLMRSTLDMDSNQE